MAQTKYTPKKAEAVLEKLAEGLSITAAMDAIGLKRSQYHNWRAAHAEFTEAADEAVESGTDRLEDIAQRRAEDQSDTLLIFLLKSRRREKYGDKWSGELSGKDGSELVIRYVNDWRTPLVPLPHESSPSDDTTQGQ